MDYDVYRSSIQAYTHKHTNTKIERKYHKDRRADWMLNNNSIFNSVILILFFFLPCLSIIAAAYIQRDVSVLLSFYVNVYFFLLSCLFVTPRSWNLVSISRPTLCFYLFCLFHLYCSHMLVLNVQALKLNTGKWYFFRFFSSTTVRSIAICLIWAWFTTAFV